MATVLTPEEFEFPEQRIKRLKREKEAKRQKEEEYVKQMDALYEQQERQKEATKPESHSQKYGDIPDYTD